MPFNNIKLFTSERLNIDSDMVDLSLMQKDHVVLPYNNSKIDGVFNKNFGIFDDKTSFDKSTEILYFKNNETNPTELTKLFMPKPFVASPSNIYHGLPWFLDYVHLSFWFFYFSIMISFLFLIYFFSFIWNNQENKYPIRETRGFSRAQVGDTMTAIVPLTWSITMLLHASTHSSNFDENTTGTQFCLTVVAYQWGWNYYYPKDIISIFNATPIKVGHNNIDYYSSFSNNYDYLLELSRQDIINKNLLLGVGSSKSGKNNVQSIQSLYLKPFSVNQNLELPVSLFVNSSMSKKNSVTLKDMSNDISKVIQLLDESNINYTYFNNENFFNNFNNLNNLNNLNYNTFLFNLSNKFLAVTQFNVKASFNFFTSSFRTNFLFDNVVNFNELLNQQTKNNFFNKQFFSDSSLKIKSIDSHRNKNTFFTNSNKFFLLYNNLFNQTECFDKNLLDEKIRDVELKNIIKSNYLSVFKSVNVNSTYNEFELLKYDDADHDCLSKFNVIVNQWLNFRKINKFFISQNSWLGLTYSNLCFNSNLHNFFFNNYKNMNFSDNSPSLYYIFFNKKNIINFNLIQQSFNYNSSDNSYLYLNSSLISFEDFGFSGTSAIKEFWYRNFLVSKFSYFNILNFYKKNFSELCVKNNYFSFVGNTFLLNNYKIWELDSDILNFSNVFFQENPFLKNLLKVSFDYNLNYRLMWPTYISNLTKNFSNVFLSYNSITNLLNYNTYVISKNFTFMKKKICYSRITGYIKNSFVLFKNFSLTDNFSFLQCTAANFFFNLKTLQYPLSFERSALSFNKTSVNADFVSVFIKNRKVNNVALISKEFNVYFIKKNKSFYGTHLFLKTAFCDHTIRFNSVASNSYFLNIFKSGFSIKPIFNLDNCYWDLFFRNSNNYNMFNFEKPVRVSLKSNDPVVFNFKLSNDISNVFYTSRVLFYWQSQWSSLIKNFHLPFYKFYKGGIEKKEYSGFWDFNNINDSFFNSSILNTNNFTISKMFVSCSYKFNKSKTDYSRNSHFLFLLDTEKFSFLKNFIYFLPNTNEDLDITYINKIWTFDVNSSRRNDHLSKFKVFWGPLFSKYIKKLMFSKNYKLSDSQSIKNVNFFKNFSSNCLNFESFYLQNISLQKNSYVTNLKIFSKYTNLKINFLKNNFFWNFNILCTNSIFEIKRICGLADYRCNLTRWYFYENNLLMYFLKNNNFLNFWSQLWLFKDNLQNYQNKLFLNKNFKESLDFLNKFFLISSFKEKEIKCVVEWSNFNYCLLDYSNSSMLNDMYSILSLYQNNFDIKNNNIVEKSMSNLSHSSLNALKYYNTSTNEHFVNSIKTVYFNYYLLQLQKSNKNRFEFKEVNNNPTAVRRLRVSKGICLPSDFSIHIICGSKDVIHSWAIPGLGIKIDCIPGFNSHRRVTFRWRGVYWGQCMEVCGRYHHWMPILIRIVHKDLFLIWCLSFLRMLNNKNFKHDRTLYNEVLLLNWSNDSSNFNLFENFFNELSVNKKAEERLLFLETVLS